MVVPDRWLWPSSESRFLQHPNYRTLVYSAPAQNPEDVLLPGSDHELDEGALRVKRRKIVSQGRAYLSGTALYISSAQLRGPFGQVAPLRNDQGYESMDDPLTSALHITQAQRSRIAARAESRFQIRRRPQIPRPSQDNEESTASPTLVVQELKRERSAHRKSSPGRTRHVLPKEKSIAPDANLNEAEDEVEVLANREPGFDVDDQSLPHADFETAPEALVVLENVDQSPEVHLGSETTTPQDDSTDTNAEQQSEHSDTGNDAPENSSAHVSNAEIEEVVLSHSRENLHLDITAGLEQARILSQSAVMKSSVTRQSDAEPANPNATLTSQSPSRAGFTPINTHVEIPEEAPATSIAADAAKTIAHDVDPNRVLQQTVHLATENLMASLPKLKNSRRKNATAGPGTSTRSGPITLVHAIAYQSVPGGEASPFMYRKPAAARRSDPPRTDMPTNLSQQGLCKPSHGEHDVQQKAMATPIIATPGVPPAINLSFDQESFGVNFELIDRFTNGRLPKSVNKSGKRNLKRAMRESGATFSGHADDAASSAGDPNSPTRPLYGFKQASPSSATNPALLHSAPKHPYEFHDAAGYAIGPPELSTQAALEEAHLALCSPIRAENHSDHPLLEDSTPGRVATSPVNAITPFSEFNKAFSPIKSSVRGAGPSTQAMFDAFSPFGVSGKKPTAKKKRASFATSQPMSPEKGRSAPRPLNDGGWSFEVLDCESAEPNSAKYQAPEPSPRRSSLLQSKENFGASPKAVNQDCPSKKSSLSSKSVKSASQKAPLRSLSDLSTEAQRPASQVNSIRLSDIFDKDYQTHETGLVRMLSHESVRSSVISGSGSHGRRGRVVDWGNSLESSVERDGHGDVDAELAPSSRRSNATQSIYDMSIARPSPSPRRTASSRQSAHSSFVVHSAMPLHSAVKSTISSGHVAGGLTSFEDAQRALSQDVDTTIDDMALMSWDVDKAMRQAGPA